MNGYAMIYLSSPFITQFFQNYPNYKPYYNELQPKFLANHCNYLLKGFPWDPFLHEID